MEDDQGGAVSRDPELIPSCFCPCKPISTKEFRNRVTDFKFPLLYLKYHKPADLHFLRWHTVSHPVFYPTVVSVRRNACAFLYWSFFSIEYWVFCYSREKKNTQESCDELVGQLQLTMPLRRVWDVYYKTFRDVLYLCTNVYCGAFLTVNRDFIWVIFTLINRRTALHPSVLYSKLL